MGVLLIVKLKGSVYCFMADYQQACISHMLVSWIGYGFSSSLVCRYCCCC
jgi:hypothetical protein